MLREMCRMLRILSVIHLHWQKGKGNRCTNHRFCRCSLYGRECQDLNPDKKVLMPDMNADCPMAHMAVVSNIRKMREEIDDLAVVCYVNSTAELKTLSDVCVTSSNAVKIVKNLPQRIFILSRINIWHLL